MTHRHDPRRTRGVALVAGVFAGSIAVVASSSAQDEGLVTIDAARCLEIESPDERLACFEGEVGEARSNPRAAPAAAAPAAAPAPPPASPPPARTVDIGNPSQRQSPDAQGEFVGSIAALSFRAPNKYLVTLDNGQIWEQQVAERYLLRVGQRVRVYPSRWGEAYRLEADDLNGFIQVTRVR